MREATCQGHQKLEKGPGTDPSYRVRGARVGQYQGQYHTLTLDIWPPEL